MKEFLNFINGEYVRNASGKTFQDINPVNGSVIGSIFNLLGSMPGNFLIFAVDFNCFFRIVGIIKSYRYLAALSCKFFG